jgi:hypothetical protein
VKTPQASGAYSDLNPAGGRNIQGAMATSRSLSAVGERFGDFASTENAERGFLVIWNG